MKTFPLLSLVTGLLFISGCRPVAAVASPVVSVTSGFKANSWDRSCARKIRGMTVQSFLINSPELDLPPSGKSSVPERRRISDPKLVDAFLSALERSESIEGYKEEPAKDDSEIKFKVKNDNLEENVTFIFNSKDIEQSKGPALAGLYKYLVSTVKNK